ncbi:MAG: SPOR domain-containing protein [Rhodothermia bacterium]|nr:MAG: SPOR domain-containing protein [Rhodothermia bacterium]
MKRIGSTEYVLGITASPKAVNAVLVHNTSGGPVILKKFHRPRGRGDTFAPLTPELSDVSSGDSSFHVGEGIKSSGAMFLGSEFGSPGDSESTPSLPDSIASDYSEMPMSMYETAERFDVELLDIVAECRTAGYEEFRIAFTVGSTFLETEEIRIGGDETPASRLKDSSKKAKTSKKKKKFKLGNGSRSGGAMMEALEEKHPGEVDAGKVTFLPMKSKKEGEQRSLAVFTTALEPVGPTIADIRERKRPLPPVDLFDTEFTLYHGLARAAYLLSAESLDSPKSSSYEEGRVLFVRAGIGDTIVMFMEGAELVLFESLRSITAIDPPETICSRVLLLQDEFGLGDADMVVLLGEERESGLVESFRTFFPDTRVELLRSYLPKHAGDGALELHGEAVLAAAVTLRIVGSDVHKKVFPPINFLPKDLLKAQFQLPFSWQIAAMYGVLFFSSLFFVYKYFDQRNEMELFRYELSQYPEDLIEANTNVLQSRLDSLRARTVGYLTSLDVLDSLLVGSDAWSRALEHTADVSADVRGIWIERWREEGEFLRLEGNATDRDEVVAFATQSNATIETLSFSEIRGWPVYSFSMRRRIPRELPKAAVYLRNNVILDKANAPAEEKQDTVGD